MNGEHQWEQLDNGTAYCLRCPATDPAQPCTAEISVVKPDKGVTVRREIDRLARQMGRIMVELQNLKEQV